MKNPRLILTISAAFLLSACNLSPTKQAVETAAVPARQTAETVAVPAPEAEITRPTSGEAHEPATSAPSNSLAMPAAGEQPDNLAPQYTDVWQRLNSELSLPRHLDNRTVKAKLAWFARNQKYLDRVAARATPYLFHIVEEVEKRNLPMELALLPIVESAFHPFAYSPSDASGIWQFIPGTGRIYGLKQNWWYDGRRDIVAATRAALDYLEKLNKQFNGDWLLALAAYNTGENNVARAIQRNRKKGQKTDFFSLRLPRETRGYVPSLLAVTELVANPKKHGVTWTPITNEPYFAQVDTGSQIDLATAAKLANLSMDELYTLNPGFNRWATDPDGPHRLLVPVAGEKSFLQGLGRLSETERVNWERHIIRPDETLGGIAARHRTSVTTLKKVNNLRSNLIRAGGDLLIPVAKESNKHYSLSLDNRRLRGLKRAGDGNKYIYTVKRGDTLWDIGRQYGVSVSQLANWNGISSRKFLRPRQKLNLWLPGGNEKSDDSSVDARQTGKGSFYYTVKKGDSLWLIAKKFNVTVEQLLAWNKVRKNSFLRPNQKLIVQSVGA